MLPGGGLLLAAGVLLGLGAPLSASALTLLFYVSCAAGLMLALRFRSSQALLTLSLVFLAQRAVTFFSPGKIATFGPSRIAIEVISVLLPINFILIVFWGEFGLKSTRMARTLGLLFLESIFVAVACRPGEIKSPAFIRYPLVNLHFLGRGIALPQLAILGFVTCLFVLMWRVLQSRKPVEAGIFWSLTAAFIALGQGGVGHVALAYFSISALAMTSALIESSYVLAYHDELTALPARRAFNAMRSTLQAPFSIAVVDIDHFKAFNDTYGHETGDQVLRMVAGKLMKVSGGGKAFRVGGEEFAIVFRGTSVEHAFPHLEALRATIADAKFQLRVAPERREIARTEPDRRTAARKATKSNLTFMQTGSDEFLSVTVSIGVAEPASLDQDISSVHMAADKALYRAKKSGRNRVESATKPRTRKARLKSSIA